MERWKQIESVLDVVLDSDPTRWPDLVEQTCGDDEILLREVEDLLERIPDIRNFLQTSVSETLFERAVGNADIVSEKEVPHIDRYRLIRELARGGMGQVYLAERSDGQFRQQAALKMLHSSFDTEHLLRRFRAERQILASLSHDHIARLFDGGVTKEGRPYIVMEYIEGEPIDRYCDSRRLTIDQRLELFITVCEAVQYAHRKLVVHRDLKPSNIWVTHDGVVKLLDFGIAKVLDPDEHPEGEYPLTQTGLLPLTPAYASPEQVRNQEITTASDVYQLGIILYELLTGSRPYEVSGRSPAEIEHIICDLPPATLSVALSKSPAKSELNNSLQQISKARKVTSAQLQKQLHGDLDTIVMKTLRKEPDRRYESAGQLAEDIRRYRSNIPIIARRGTLQYRLGKWFRRHRWAASTGLAVMLSLMIGTGVALWQAREATQSAERATLALAETEQALNRAEALQEFLLDLFRSAEPDRPRDQLPTTEEILALGAERALDEESAEPAERFNMLLNIGRIYRQQNWNEQARPLLEAAVDLAHEHREERPEDLSLALWQLAVLFQEQRDQHQSEALLLEAEAAIEGMDVYWNTFAKVRAERGWVEYRRGNPAGVVSLNEPLYLEMQERDDVQDHTRLLVMTPLLGANSSLGNLSVATALSEEIIEIVKRTEGPESLTYAVQLANSVQLEYNLGRFDIAEAKAREAIALYNRIYDPEQPVAYRAVAHFHLAYAMLYAGRFDESLENLGIYNEEQARVRGTTIDHWEYTYLNRGSFFARMHRWPEAEQELRTARGLFDTPGEVDHSWLINLDALLAITLCRQHNTEEGREMLAEIDSRLDGRDSDSATHQALIHEARAFCYFHAEQPDLALQETDAAIAADNYPGRVMYQADRRILRARILAAMNNGREAEEELIKAEQMYLDLNLSDHPHLQNIATVRQELF